MRLVVDALFVCLIDGSVVDAECVNEKKTNFEWLVLEWQEDAPCRSDTDDGDVFSSFAHESLETVTCHHDMTTNG